MTITLINSDAFEALKGMADESVQLCVTSPPFWGLRDYGFNGQMGLEPTPSKYIKNLVKVFEQVRRVLKSDGTLWLNIGDSYAGGGNGGGGSFMKERGHTAWANHARLSGFRKAPTGLKPKDLVGIPWMLAFALRDAGWYLRSDIIWAKPNPVPESVRDRPTKSHEHIFLFAKSKRYYYDADAIKEMAKTRNRRSAAKGSFKAKGEPLPGQLPFRAIVDQRNKRDVWMVATQPNKEAHFATYPVQLIRPCILAGSRPGDVVLDPFNGSGTTGFIACQLGRKYIGVDLNPDYIEITKRRLAKVQRELPLRSLNGLLPKQHRL